MRWRISPALKSWLGLFFLLVLARADQVLDLGSLDQYNPHRDPPSTLSSNIVWLSARDDNEERGFLVAVSPDVKDKLSDALTSCPTLDNSCFQYDRGILRAADLEVDSSVSRRDFSLIVARQAKLLGSFFTEIVGLFIAQWRFNHYESVRFVPATQANQVATVTNGIPLTISAAGTAIVTVTMAPDPTTVNGATVFMSDDQDAVAGDIAITFDKSVANRLSDVMRGTMGCKEGSGFDAEQGQKRDTKYGNVVYGVRAAMEMATPRAPVHDLTFIQVVTPDLLYHLGAQFIAAVQRAIDITQDYAPLLETLPEVFDDIIVVVFALGVHTLINNNPLSGRNVMSKDILDSND